MPYLPGLSPVGAKSLTATSDAGRLSSDGGLIVLREIATRLGVAETITGPLRDDRDASRVRHSYAEMAIARMLMIAAGYEDCDDVDTLRTDPALKIAVGRAPESGADLMSQPTLSRLENLADWRALARIGLGQIDLYCKSFARPPVRIVLDIDDTDDPVHGQQELALFNAHYDCICAGFSDAGHDGLATRTGRRRRSAKARSRGRMSTVGAAGSMGILARHHRWASSAVDVPLAAEAS